MSKDRLASRRAAYQSLSELFQTSDPSIQVDRAQQIMRAAQTPVFIMQVYLDPRFMPRAEVVILGPDIPLEVARQMLVQAQAWLNEQEVKQRLAQAQEAPHDVPANPDRLEDGPALDLPGDGDATRSDGEEPRLEVAAGEGGG